MDIMDTNVANKTCLFAHLPVHTYTNKNKFLLSCHVLINCLKFRIIRFKLITLYVKSCTCRYTISMLIFNYFLDISLFSLGKVNK